MKRLYKRKCIHVNILNIFFMLYNKTYRNNHLLNRQTYKQTFYHTKIQHFKYVNIAQKLLKLFDNNNKLQIILFNSFFYV